MVKVPPSFLSLLRDALSELTSPWVQPGAVSHQRMLPGQLAPRRRLLNGSRFICRRQNFSSPTVGLAPAVPRDPAGAESRCAGSEPPRGLFQPPAAPRFLQASFNDDELIKIEAGSRHTGCRAFLPGGELCATAVPGLKTNPRRACAGALRRVSINKRFLTMQIKAYQLLAWGWKRAKNGWVC